MPEVLGLGRRQDSGLGSREGQRWQYGGRPSPSATLSTQTESLASLFPLVPSRVLLLCPRVSPLSVVPSDPVSLSLSCC